MSAGVDRAVGSQWEMLFPRKNQDANSRDWAKEEWSPVVLGVSKPSLSFDFEGKMLE